MAAKDRPKESQDTTSDKPSTVNAEDVLRPFQEASNKFLQAHRTAQESAIRQRAQACLDFQDQVRQVEQEVYRAAMEATRKHVNQLGQEGAGSIDQIYAARAQSQFEYENEVRQIYADAQTKLNEVARKASDESSSGDAAGQLNSQRQDAYKTYLSDLQQAWSGTRALDPQTMNAIASQILFTISAASQAG